MKLSVVSLGVLLFSSVSFANVLECDILTRNERENRTATVEFNQLSNCDFIRPGTVCDFVEGKDQFWSYNFEPSVIANAKVGDSIRGSYFEGYVWKSWIVTSEDSMTCVLK